MGRKNKRLWILDAQEKIAQVAELAKSALNALDEEREDECISLLFDVQENVTNALRDLT